MVRVVDHVDFIRLLYFIHEVRILESAIKVIYSILCSSQNERFKNWTFEKFKILELETQNIIPDSHKSVSVNNKSYGLFKNNNSGGNLTSSGYGIKKRNLK